MSHRLRPNSRTNRPPSLPTGSAQYTPPPKLLTHLQNGRSKGISHPPPPSVTHHLIRHQPHHKLTQVYRSIRQDFISDPKLPNLRITTQYLGRTTPHFSPSPSHPRVGHLGLYNTHTIVSQQPKSSNFRTNPIGFPHFPHFPQFHQLPTLSTWIGVLLHSITTNYYYLRQPFYMLYESKHINTRRDHQSHPPYNVRDHLNADSITPRKELSITDATTDPASHILSTTNLFS